MPMFNRFEEAEPTILRSMSRPGFHSDASLSDLLRSEPGNLGITLGYRTWISNKTSALSGAQNGMYGGRKRKCLDRRLGDHFVRWTGGRWWAVS